VSAERFRWSQGSVTASGPVSRRDANGFGRDRLGVNPSPRTRRAVSRVNQQCAGITFPAACEGGEPALSCVSSDQWGGAKSGVHPLRRRADACRTRETEPNEGKHAGGAALLVFRPCARTGAHGRQTERGTTALPLGCSSQHRRTGAAACPTLPGQAARRPGSAPTLHRLTRRLRPPPSATRL
jgi:hypothetical protein